MCLLLIYTRSYQFLLKHKYYNTTTLFHSLVLDWQWRHYNDMHIENTKHAETNSESRGRQNTNKTDHWKFPKMRWSDIYIRMNITRIGCWGITKKIIIWHILKKYWNDYYYYYKFVFYIRLYQMLQKSTNKRTQMPTLLTFNQFLRWHETRWYQFVNT